MSKHPEFFYQKRLFIKIFCHTRVLLLLILRVASLKRLATLIFRLPATAEADVSEFRVS